MVTGVLIGFFLVGCFWGKRDESTRLLKKVLGRKVLGIFLTQLYSA